MKGQQKKKKKKGAVNCGMNFNGTRSMRKQVTSCSICICRLHSPLRLRRHHSSILAPPYTIVSTLLVFLTYLSCPPFTSDAGQIIVEPLRLSQSLSKITYDLTEP